MYIKDNTIQNRKMAHGTHKFKRLNTIIHAVQYCFGISKNTVKCKIFHSFFI